MVFVFRWYAAISEDKKTVCQIHQNYLVALILCPLHVSIPWDGIVESSEIYILIKINLNESISIDFTVISFIFEL